MPTSFDDFGFDERILAKIAESGWADPTSIQETMFNFVLNKRNIIAKARTGSGKTAAYALPLIDRNLKNRDNKSIILVPSRELSQQVYRMIKSFAPSDVYVYELSDEASADSFQIVPDLIVTTPTKLVKHVDLIKKSNSLSLYKTIVIDEADLITTFGHSNALKKIVNWQELSQVQLVLCSATLDMEDDELEELNEILNISEPVVLSLKSLPSQDRLRQFNVSCNEVDDKFLLLMALLKLRLLTGKSLIFCNDVDSCYKVRMFLEQFGLKSVVLNAEMPYKSRLHTLAQFNRGSYDIMVASDETNMTVNEKASKTSQKDTKKHNKKLKEYSVARGVDFNDVNNVLNFDLPATIEQYIHRVGRTARGEHSTGIALSFVHSLNDHNLVKKISEKCEILAQPFAFKVDEISGLRYRCSDALRTVTQTRIKEARLKELKAEILNSASLKEYFEDNPRDLQLLRHDKILSKRTTKMQTVPDYLIPDSLRTYLGTTTKKRKHQSSSKEFKKKIFLNKKKKVEKAKSKKSSDPLNF